MKLAYLILVVCICAGCEPEKVATGRGQSASPRDAAEYLRLGKERFEKGEFDAAIRDFDEVIKLEPTNALAFAGRGTAWFRKKEYEKAIKDLDEAVRLVPEPVPALHALRGAALYMKKDYARAVKDLDRAIELNAKEIEALNSRAWAAAVCPDAKYRDDKLALKYAREACKLDGHKNPFYIGTLAAAHAANGQFDEAVRWQTKALESKEYVALGGDNGKQMLALFKERKPYREDPPDKP